MSSSNNPSATIVAAQLFAKSGNAALLSGLTPWALEDELMKYAAANAAAGESEAAAVTRLTREDEIAKALARAAYHAEQAMNRLPAGEQLDAFRKHLGVDDALAKAAPAARSREQVADLMDEIARRERRPGETFADAYDRLAREDDVFKRALSAYNAKGA